jgi:hypothetical protein
MKRIRKLLACSIVLLISLSSCGAGFPEFPINWPPPPSPPPLSIEEGVSVEVSVPLHVKQGSQFELTIQISNRTSEEQKLKSIKIDKDYLEAIAIIKTEPNYKNVSNKFLGNQKVYEFQLPIDTKKETEFKFYAEALKKGRYIPKIEVDTTYEFSSFNKEINAIID